MVGIKDDVSHITNAKFHPVIAFQRFPLHPFAVNECPMLAALIEHIELAVFRRDESMITRDARIGDYQVFVYSASDAERTVVEIDGALLVSLHENQRGEDP